MFDEYGKPLNEALPSTPVSIMGLNDLPEAGDSFENAKNEKAARTIVEERLAALADGDTAAGRAAPTLQDIFAQFAAGKAKELNLIVKVDVQGSLQPIVDGLKSLSETNSEGIGVRILASEIGNISENDVMLASASGAIIIGFSVDVDNAARRSADSQGVDIRLYSVIYKLFEDIELALKGMLAPVFAEKVIGTAEVRALFKIAKIGVIAGSYVREGEIRRNARARVKRGNRVLAENLAVSSLKRVSEDVREVRTGFECGIGLDGFNDFKEGDMIEFYISERVS
jgi:translation initiation factor IF-2